MAFGGGHLGFSVQATDPFHERVAKGRGDWKQFRGCTLIRGMVRCPKESGCVNLQWPLQPLGLLMGMIIRAALGIKEQCVPGTL